MEHVVCGAGPLGVAVAALLRESGQERVRLVTRSGHATAPAGVATTAADLADPADATRALRGAAVVYHCAAPAMQTWSHRLVPLMDGVIAGAAAAGARVIYGDNLDCYGPVDGPIREDLPNRPVGPHARARADAADRLMAAHRDGRVPAAVSRASDFFGPGVRVSAVGERVFAAALTGRPAALLPGVDTEHTYTFVGDLAAALVTLGSHEQALGQVWHAPSPPAGTTRGFVEQVFALAGHPSRIRVLPKPVLRAAGLVSARMRALGHRLYQTEQPFVIDDAKYRAAFRAGPTDIDAAITRTLDWYRQNQ